MLMLMLLPRPPPPVLDRHLNSTLGHEFSTTPIDVSLFRFLDRFSRASSISRAFEVRRRGERDTSEEMLIATLVISLGLSSIREYGGINKRGGEKERREEEDEPVKRALRMLLRVVESVLAFRRPGITAAD